MRKHHPTCEITTCFKNRFLVGELFDRARSACVIARRRQKVKYQKSYYQEIMSICPQLCLLAFRALYENKRVPRNAHFQKSLKVLRNGVIKTLCAKNQVCKSIGVTCSTQRNLQSIKKKILENGRKRALKEPKIKFSKKQKIVLFFSCPKEYYVKKLGL